jgi:hypothetical protein
MIYLLSAWSSFLDQADNFFLSCPIKYLTGFDCPGCGFQRSFLALIQGNLEESFRLYPPTVPLLITFVVGLSANYLNKGNSDKLIKILYLITASIITISYLFKMCVPHTHS